MKQPKRGLKYECQMITEAHTILDQKSLKL
jgi:hypothetical protein